MPGPEPNVPDRVTDCNRKASAFGQVTFETRRVASQEQLESARNTREDHPHSKISHLEWWLEENNVVTGQPLHPLAHALQIVTDASKEAWGAHMDTWGAHKRTHGKGSWSLPESKLHINYIEIKAVLLALKEFQALYKQGSSRD